jgi:hypothetical protein
MGITEGAAGFMPMRPSASVHLSPDSFWLQTPSCAGRQIGQGSVVGLERYRKA